MGPLTGRDDESIDGSPPGDTAEEDRRSRRQIKPTNAVALSIYSTVMSILSELEIHPCLRSRVFRLHRAPTLPAEEAKLPAEEAKRGGFVLYLPTVCLRIEQNPGFALACHAANHLRVPLVVLAVVPDDASHGTARHPHRAPIDGADAIVMTSRRLAFVMQALAHCGAKWSEHGAAVGVRVHSTASPLVKGARTPDHLSLASRASVVVCDEPFVSPYSTIVNRVEQACAKSQVECLRVDGSCTVPPVSVLRWRNSYNVNGLNFDGLPAKAYQWQSKTEHLRQGHLNAAMEGHFDAPDLLVKMDDEDMFSHACPLAHLFPARWKATSDDGSNSMLPNAPDVRPFTSKEMTRIYEEDDYVLEEGSKMTASSQQKPPPERRARQDVKPFHNFALNWPGADSTVPPCEHTVGTTAHGMTRWNNFVQRGGMSRYGKERNDPRKVHSPSRMSAYLNLGIVSIFRLVWEVKKQQQKGKASSQTNKRWNKSGPDKYEEEIVKWREFSYAHAFSREDYDAVLSLPRWSMTCLDSHEDRSRYTLDELATGNTGESTWDAMQKYLVNTGELHNNVRMTWGKTVVEWVGCSTSSPGTPASLTLRTLCYLNDRYALDGLSPPSYAGVLWCHGWTEKPTGNGYWIIPTKHACRYKVNASELEEAAALLLSSQSERGEVGTGGQRSVLDMMHGKKQPSKGGKSVEEMESRGSKRKGGTIDSFFKKSSKKNVGSVKIVG